MIFIHNTAGKSDKRANNKIAKAEAALGRFGLDPSNIDSHLPWQISASDLKLAQQRLEHICIPEHLDFCPIWLFSHSTRLKSHDWKQVCNHRLSWEATHEHKTSK